MSDWSLVYNDWNPDEQPLREALCTLGNGYFATRGAAEEIRKKGNHYPGTYLAGGYNRLKTEVAGQWIENEDLVNWPNWLPLNFRIGEGDWFDLESVDIHEFRQVLDLKNGLLQRRILFTDSDQRITILNSERFVSMANPHTAAICWEITPKNWQGKLTVRAGLDADIRNEGVARYKDLNSDHLEIVERGFLDRGGLTVVVQTNQSKIRMAQASRLYVSCGKSESIVDYNLERERKFLAEEVLIEAEVNAPVRVEKIVALYTSRDFAISEAAHEAVRTIKREPSYTRLNEQHQLAWEQLWDRCDLRLKGNERAQLILRLHIFHLLQTVSPNSFDLDIGVPARGWHGEAYRGHIFWDELFIFPYLNLRLPEITRSLLLHRYRRLSEAKRAASDAGYSGAMYPWQSGSNGREESQKIHLNPRSGRWLPDNTYLQRHINVAIVYNIWNYYQATADTEFLSFYGAEMALEITRFLADLVTFNSSKDRYEVHGVVGPDEYHTRYPNGDREGIDNNAYTNVMIAWTMEHARLLLKLLTKDRKRELLKKLCIDRAELLRWASISKKMFVPFHDGNIISQFEGFDELEEFDWEHYRNKYEDLHRLDRLLEAEDDDVNRYKVSKQSDVLMLFYLFSNSELEEIFGRLGYKLTADIVSKNIEYYIDRTSHGSTLSRVVSGWVLARQKRDASWGLFKEALESDVADIQGGTTAEGIHLGAMAGTVDMVQRCYTGIEARDDILWFDPCLPDKINEMDLRVRFRGRWISVYLTKELLKLRFDESRSESLSLGFRGQVYSLTVEKPLEFELKSDNSDDCHIY